MRPACIASSGPLEEARDMTGIGLGDRLIRKGFGPAPLQARPTGTPCTGRART